MGGSAACYQGASSFEPPLDGKAQLEHFLLSYSASVDDLAKIYRGLGDAYHDLPLHVRNHARFPQELQDLSTAAFICSDSREMPDMIQLMNQLRERFARARASIVCGEFALAVHQLKIAAWLVHEGEIRVADLSWVMTWYGNFIESLKNSVGAQAYCTLFRQASVGRNVLRARALMKSRWQDALPKDLQDFETEKNTDSGYNSTEEVWELD